MALGPLLTAFLKQTGLEGLTKWASDMIIKGASQDEIQLLIYDQPAFKARFPAIFTRQAANLPPISVQDYLNFEQTVYSMAHTAGMPLSQTEINDLLTNDVSAQEVDQRLQIAVEAVNSDQETRQFLQDKYGPSMGQLMKFWMNPKAELPALQHQFRTGQIGGAATRTGYGDISLAQAQRLESTGMTGEQAASGFSQLTQLQPLFQPFNDAEDTITTDDQIALLTGDQGVQQLVEQRQRNRTADFEGGGSFAQSKEGFATGTAK